MTPFEKELKILCRQRGFDFSTMKDRTQRIFSEIEKQVKGGATIETPIGDIAPLLVSERKNPFSGEIIPPHIRPILVPNEISPHA